MKHIFLLASAFLLSMLFLFQKEVGWRGIVPLHSTRADVERVLGAPSDKCKCLYKTEDIAVVVEYARSPCKGALLSWDVPADTVLSLTVRSKNKQRFSDLNLDLGKYVLRQDDTMTRYYTNKDAGIEYEVSTEGTINSVSYIPSAKDSHLRCSGFPAYAGSSISYRPFDKYSNIPFNDAKARLDSFAIQLHQNPTAIGYIMVYAVRRAHVGEAHAQAERAKNYLINVRGLDAARVVTIDGGHQEEFTVELYVVPRGAPAPTATPTVAPGEVQIIKAVTARTNNRRSFQLRCKQRRPCQ